MHLLTHMTHSHALPTYQTYKTSVVDDGYSLPPYLFLEGCDGGGGFLLCVACHTHHFTCTTWVTLFFRYSRRRSRHLCMVATTTQPHTCFFCPLFTLYCWRTPEYHREVFVSILDTYHIYHTLAFSYVHCSSISVLLSQWARGYHHFTMMVLFVCDASMPPETIVLFSFTLYSCTPACCRYHDWKQHSLE